MSRSMWSDDEEYESEDDTPAVLRRPAIANHIVQERITVETADHEDHTFCGVMWNVKCIDTLPIDFLEITSVAVRGGLGPMTVWSTPDCYDGKFELEECKKHWTKRYERTHARSFREVVPLELDEPVQLKPGEGCGLYVHSTKRGDSAVVYDNMRQFRNDAQRDNLLSILPGMAALDSRPFGQMGMWGEGWRRRREFVGRVGVGVCWKLWNPTAEVHELFPKRFRAAVWTILLCGVRPSAPLHCLNNEVLYYIINMCRWDWFGDKLREEASETQPQANTAFTRNMATRPGAFRAFHPSIWQSTQVPRGSANAPLPPEGLSRRADADVGRRSDSEGVDDTDPDDDESMGDDASSGI